MPNAAPSGLTDQKLFILCKSYGLQSKIWRQKFIGLLPEVNRRRLYERRGFVSIFDFAVKLAGISEMQVRRVINMERSLAQTPVLQNLLIQGEVSVSKLVRVISVATPQNQQALADQLKLLPQRAVETLVRDEKAAASGPRDCPLQSTLGVNQNLPAATQNYRPSNQDLSSGPAQNQNGLQESQKAQEDVRAHTSCNADSQSNNYNIDINKDLPLLEKLSPQLKEKLLELMNKGIDINNLLLQLINLHEKEIAAEKEALSAVPARPSRHIPVMITRLIKKEFGSKCSVPACHRPAQTLHHTNIFALSKTHDPKFIAPLCKEHHILAHSLNIKFLQKRQH